MLRKQYIKSAIAFLILIFIFPVIFFISDKKDFSETENRSLAKRPEISVESVADKSYMNGIEAYLSDHFPARINWVKAKLNLERLSGKELINGIYITDDRMYEKLPEPDYDEIDLSVNSINKFAEMYDTKTFVMIAPTSAGIYRDKLEPYLPQVNQKKLINEVYGKFGDNVHKIDIFSAMYSERDEYIYYRTDHHWTSKGAFTAYKAAARKMGLPCYEDYDVEKAADDFRGTFYSKCLYDGIKPDQIDIFKPGNNVVAYSLTLNDGINEEYARDIYFPEFLETNDKYCLFLGHNRALTKIKTNADTKRKLLLIKDSYANSFVPFLIQNYSEISVIDLRYVKTCITDYADPNEFDHTLFLYNASTFSIDKNIKNVGLTQ